MKWTITLFLYMVSSMKLNPPDYTKRIENCRFRLSNDSCCHAKNPLRPHTCNGYCVEKLDAWLRADHPELDDETITEIIIEFTDHDRG